MSTNTKPSANLEAPVLYRVDTFNHLTDYITRDVYEFGTIKEARAKLSELFNERVCATIYDVTEGKSLNSNYPNVYALYGADKAKAYELWKAPVTAESSHALHMLMMKEAY